MIIRKIQMVNFRGFRNKIIDFRDKPVVLLSAANGMGKTTTIDAIEWCLTGGIGRLKSAFDTRSTNEADRRMNTDGILKNRDAGENEKAMVSLWLLDGETEHILCREQSKDELNPKNSRVTLDQSEEEAELFIQECIGDSFYNFHCCDVQKSFNIQSKKRGELVSLFNEFITNYDQQMRIAENLDVFAEDVERYIEDKKKQMVSQKEIDTYNEQIELARKAAVQKSYPAIVFYSEENTEVSSLTPEALREQKKVLIDCGYQVAEKALFQLMENENDKRLQSVMAEIASYWEKKGEALQRAVELGFSKNSAAITVLEQKLQKLKEMSLTKNTIFRDGELLLSLGIAGVDKPVLDAFYQAVQERNKRVQALADEIDLLTRNNKMLRLLSSLSANKSVIVEHRDEMLRKNGAVRCPVCGADAFASMEEELILKEAESYIKENGENVKEKEKEQGSLCAEIDAIYQKVVDQLKDIVEKERKKLSEDIENLRRLKEEVEPYFDAVRKMKLLGQNVDVDVLTADKVQEVLTAVENRILADSEEQKAREVYQSILAVTGYEFAEEAVPQTYQKVKQLISARHEVSSFSYKTFVEKLNSIDGILANQSLLALQQKRNADIKKNQKLREEIDRLEDLKKAAFQRALDIRNVVGILSNDEYKRVGPALGKFFDKLTRSHTETGIHTVLEKSGISLIDDKGKNIVNVLSNGQISVFMLAYFFAGIHVRSDHEKMKVYFIDDLTACMDDVNMLAFMDLLKYQMTSKATMNQLFFSTCDNRISKLLKYKLDGRGIALRELVEADFT